MNIDESARTKIGRFLYTKKDAYVKLKRVRDEMHELAVHKAIFEELRDIAEHDRSDEKRRERDKRFRQ